MNMDDMTAHGWVRTQPPQNMNDTTAGDWAWSQSLKNRDDIRSLERKIDGGTALERHLREFFKYEIKRELIERIERKEDEVQKILDETTAEPGTAEYQQIVGVLRGMNYVRQEVAWE